MTKYNAYKGKGAGAIAPGTTTKHRKLSEEDVQDILYLYCEQGLKQRTIAEYYGVSVRTIQFILNPQSAEKNRNRKNNQDKTAQRERMRRLRERRKNSHGEHSED